MCVWLDSIMLGTSAYQTDYTIVFITQSLGIPSSWIQSTKAPKIWWTFASPGWNYLKQPQEELILKACWAFATFFRMMSGLQTRHCVLWSIVSCVQQCRVPLCPISGIRRWLFLFNLDHIRLEGKNTSVMREVTQYFIYLLLTAQMCDVTIAACLDQ